MRFTLWAVGAPLFLLLLDIILRSPHKGLLPLDTLGWIGGLWFWSGLPCTFLYWLVRLVRYAWRSPAAPASSRPGSWIYPDERP